MLFFDGFTIAGLLVGAVMIGIILTICKKQGCRIL